ncbi:uncharacterized protein LOC108104903 isoform X2 [Drosophila eugracilis]|uniref:uncharacterized protein LOC108104903 isoform X2 n=1 Tax=Drosophila eugracilis TaxID=29029 RepID=UPI0007E84AB0|nr:uncharacterized protein LOC108104903 isoform X2 [Drosophila eugracilis]
MCACPAIILKIALLISIACAIAFDVMEILSDSVNTTTNPVLIKINSGACFIAFVFMTIGLYGALMNTLCIIRLIICAVLTTMFCMRLHEQTREFQLGF